MGLERFNEGMYGFGTRLGSIFLECRMSKQGGVAGPHLQDALWPKFAQHCVPNFSIARLECSVAKHKACLVAAVGKREVD